MVRKNRSCNYWLNRIGLAGIAAMAMLLSNQVLAQNLVQNPSFETNTLANWTLVSSGTGGWVTSSSALTISDGLVGTRTDYSAQAAGSAILYQDVVLPATGTYTFQASVGCYVKGGLATEFCRADITDTSPGTIVAPTAGVDTLATTGTGVLTPLFSLGSSFVNSVIADTIVFNITGLAGQTVRVRFMSSNPSTDQLAGMSVVDNVRLIRTAPPVAASSIPTNSEWGLVLMAMLLAGVAFGEFRRRQGTRR